MKALAIGVALLALAAGVAVAEPRHEGASWFVVVFPYLIQAISFKAQRLH